MTGSEVWPAEVLQNVLSSIDIKGSIQTVGAWTTQGMIGSVDSLHSRSGQRAAFKHTTAFVTFAVSKLASSDLLKDI